ncbi:hypothetical protein D9611_010688 [Ephemerocybe angulata]|uniref:Uncharacterized protein n=1 Tax=Ephemerocybe angulata TaxID=980116 RepID=A0A8H5BE70_9AGAR|nr:hypothetical protein D9611_010688 [Tulosesus angulatus]
MLIGKKVHTTLTPNSLTITKVILLITSGYITDVSRERRMVQHHNNCNFVPIVACRLLLNIRMPEDRALFSRVSTLLFEPGGRMSSLQSDSSTSEKPHKRAQFLGIGRTCGMKKGKKEVEENAAGSDGDCETLQEEEV